MACTLEAQTVSRRFVTQLPRVLPPGKVGHGFQTRCDCYRSLERHRIAIAKRLARTGAMVAVHYKANEAGASAVVRSIEADGGSAFAIGADVSKPNEVIALIDAIVGRCGKIDILVNNAGILEYGLFG